MTVIVFLLILGLLILVHEFGHFIAAKKSGVLVEEFGFGFPPRLFSIKKGETIYSINLLPFGGFVKVFGEEYHENDQLTQDKKQRAFVYKKPWQKSVIIIAGIIGNFLLGWVLISYLFTQGVPTPTNQVLVEQVTNNSPAYFSHLKSGDIIEKAIINNNSYQFTSATDFIALNKKFAGKPIQLIVMRSHKEVTLEITPRKNPPPGQGPLGVTITSFIEKKYSWYEAPFYGLVEAANITQRIIVELTKTIAAVVTLKKPNVEVAGPIGIAQFTGQAIKFGKNAVLELTALLSLNLAVINILPFPALDGGRLSFVLYEWVTKRRVNKSFEKYTNIFGIAVLLSLAILITIHDIIKLYR